MEVGKEKEEIEEEIKNNSVIDISDEEQEIEEDDSLDLEIEDIQLEEDVKTVLRLSDLCSGGDIQTLYNARNARKGRMDKPNELSLSTMHCVGSPQPNNISWFLAITLTTATGFYLCSGVLLLITSLKEYGIFFSFIGSLAWTIGGFLSYFEVINSVNNVNDRFQITRLCVNRPQQVDWWIGVLSFISALFLQVSFIMVSFLDTERFAKWNLGYAICLIMGCCLTIISSLFQLAEGSGKGRCLTWNPREPWYWNTIFFILGSICWGFMCIMDIFFGLYFVSLILYLCGSSCFFLGSYSLIIEIQN